LRLFRSPKLQLAALWPALAALATAGLLLWQLLPKLMGVSAAEQLLETVRLVEAEAAQRLASNDAGALQRWAVETVRGTNLRLTLADARGRVLADSALSAAQLAAVENHAEREEIRRAMASGSGVAARRSETTGVDYVYAARALSLPRGRLAVVRLAQPIASLQALQGQLGRTLALAALAALLAVGLVGWWLNHRIFRPLSAVVAGAHRVAAGDLAHRVAVPDEPEVATLAAALNRLASRVEEQLAAAAAERDHLQAILAGMSEGVLVTGPDGRAGLANPAFRRLFGFTGEIIGRTPLEISRQPVLDRLVRDTAARGEAGTATIELDSPERRTIALTSAPLSAGRGVVVVARDVSPLIRLAEMRRDFVANVSHELKTPLAAIRGYAETLHDGALADPATSPRFVERILSQCRRLQALLDDLLTLSRLEGVREPAEREPVDLGELARRTLEIVASSARERGVALEIAAGSIPPLLGSADGLERLLLNLLDNAVKYNRPGGRVTVRLAQRGGEAAIEVADTGIGIPPDSLPRLFERFYRVDKSRSRDEGGTGLGLAIVKHVAQTHGGRVEVESEPGKGTTFRVILPLAPPAARD
jgi:two-component system phosphate regulon sensor histidine kinase PhoR